MTSKTTVDARGLSCPQPVIMMKRALQRAAGGNVEILVTSHTARDNIERLASGLGLQTRVNDQGEFISIMITDA